MFGLTVKQDMGTKYLRLCIRCFSENPDRRRDKGNYCAGLAVVWVRSRARSWTCVFGYVHTTGLEKRDC